MRIHYLSINERAYKHIALGYKPFIITKNDNKYNDGDLIQFILIQQKQEYSKNSCEPSYTSVDDAVFKITFVEDNFERLRNNYFSGLESGYCVLGLKEVEIVDVNR